MAHEGEGEQSQRRPLWSLVVTGGPADTWAVFFTQFSKKIKTQFSKTIVKE